MAIAAHSRSARSDSIAPVSTIRLAARDRVLVIGDCGASRSRIVSALGDAGYVSYEQPSPIGATRMLIHHGIPAAVVELTMPGLSLEKLITLLRNNPRLEGLIVVVVTTVELSSAVSSQGLELADAVVLREQVQNRLIPTLKRLLCTSGFHQKAPNLAAFAPSEQNGQ